MRMNGDQNERARKMVAERHVQLRPPALARYARRYLLKHTQKIGRFVIGVEKMAEHSLAPAHNSGRGKGYARIMISSALIDRIVYAKYLFHQGCENIERTLPITDGIAILNFQDAAEMLLRTIAEYVNASIKESSTFSDIIQKIEEAPNNHQKSKIPFRTALNQLNKARVNFKHFGLLPQTSDVRKLHRDIELFFYEALEVFFDLKFDEISLARLIKRHRVKNYLLQAEEYLHQDLFTDCINSTAKAFTILFHNVSEFIHLEISPFDQFEDRKIDNVMKAIQRQFQVNQEQLNILKFGINLAEYERFKSIIPRLSVSDVGVIGGYLLNATSDSRSLEDAQFGLRFAIDAALRIQQNPLPKKSLRIESLRKFRAVQETMMIVYPESSDIEHIRAVGKGEILTGYYKNHDKEDHVAIVDDDELSYVPNNTVEEIT